MQDKKVELDNQISSNNMTFNRQLTIFTRECNLIIQEIFFISLISLEISNNRQKTRVSPSMKHLMQKEH